MQREGPPEQALALLQAIAPAQPEFRRAQHLRGLCALRQGDADRAQALLLDALRRGERNVSVCLNLARAAAAASHPSGEALAALGDTLQAVATDKVFPFTVQLLQILGFTASGWSPAKDEVFERLLLPLLTALLQRRDMDNALSFENLIYQHYVKATETEDHFARCLDRLSPPFTEAGRHWREVLPILPQADLTPPYRIGFFIHNASTLAHIEVLLNTLKGHRRLDPPPFEPVVYCFSGKSPEMEQALRDLDVRLVMLNERFPETRDSSWERLLRFRELLAQDGVQELVWVSLVTMLPLAFSLRLAPVQTWLAMKYRNFSHEEIDGYVTGSALTRFGTLGGRRWRMGMLGVDDWYDPALESRAAALRASLGAPLVLMTLARTEKMQDPAYLSAVAAVLKAHPDSVFLWAGREELPQVANAFRAAGVFDRTRFIGWVNTRLFAQVADIFLDTFPFPCGFTLFQAMAAGKPVVVYASPEAGQTGLWAFLKPVLQGEEGAAAERAELAAFVGDPDRPLISIAHDPRDYVRLAGRLVADPEGRAAAGEASRGFIRRYFSDPRVLGESLGRHFVELIEEQRARRSA